MIRPASISLTSACRSPEESFEVSTRNVVGAKRAVIFCNWASPGAELVFRDLAFWARMGMALTPKKITRAITMPRNFIRLSLDGQKLSENRS